MYKIYKGLPSSTLISPASTVGDIEAGLLQPRQQDLVAAAARLGGEVEVGVGVKAGAASATSAATATWRTPGRGDRSPHRHPHHGGGGRGGVRGPVQGDDVARPRPRLRGHAGAGRVGRGASETGERKQLVL